MLQLFQSIFGSGRGDHPPHSTELIARAIERAVDGTNPRLRTLPGYRKALHGAVVHAVDHAVALVDGLPPGLELDPRLYTTDPEITAFFASVENAREVLECDPTLNQWRASTDGKSAAQVVMLLLMTLEERNVLGVALDGDNLRHGVAQINICFSKHQLIDPSATEDETRRLLKRRSFDHLLALALGEMAAATVQRGALERERSLLRRKNAALAAGNWSFSEGGREKFLDPSTLQQQLAHIESQLATLGSGTGLLNSHLDIVLDVLTHAEQHFWSTRHSLNVDRMGVKQTQASALAPSIDLLVLQNSSGQRLIARLVRVDREALPAQRDLLLAVERYLG
jgi:hypothetical protein